MFQVKIFIETSITGPGRRKGEYAGLVEYIKRNGDPETREVIGQLDNTTFNQSTIVAAVESLKILNKNCDVTIITNCRYFNNVVERNFLKEWEENEWNRPNGKEVSNAQEWESFLNLKHQHRIKVEYATKHEYKNYLKEKLDHKE